MNFIATKCVFSACSCYVRTERITTADLNTRGNVITYTSSSGEVILQIYSHPYLDLFSHFKRKKQTKKKHVQTDTNVKHREKKVQIFWRRFVFLFLFFSVHLFFWTSGTSLIFLLHLSLSCQQAYRCLPSVPSALVSASRSFSSHTRRPTGNRKKGTREGEKERERDGGKENKRKCIHPSVLVSCRQMCSLIAAAWQDNDIAQRAEAHSDGLTHTKIMYVTSKE